MQEVGAQRTKGGGGKGRGTPWTDGRSQSQELPAAARFSYPDAQELAHTGVFYPLEQGG